MMASQKKNSTEDIIDLVVQFGEMSFMAMRDGELWQTRIAKCVFHTENQNVGVEKQSCV